MGGKESLPPGQDNRRRAGRALDLARDNSAWGRRKRQSCQKAAEGRERKGREGEMPLTECEDNVEYFFAGQFGRDGSGGGGGGTGRLGKLLGDDWDGHRGERDDDDEQIEARPEEGFRESSREVGHDSDSDGV